MPCCVIIAGAIIVASALGVRCVSSFSPPHWGGQPTLICCREPSTLLSSSAMTTPVAAASGINGRNVREMSNPSADLTLTEKKGL